MFPILFHVGHLAVPAYALGVLGAMLVAVALVPRSARRNGIDLGDAFRTCLISGATGVVGARLLHLAIVLPRILEDPPYAKTIVMSGGVWYGGLIASFAADLWCFRRFGIPILAGADTIAVPTVVGGGLGRIACFLSGCCFGSPTTVPWAVTYTSRIAHRLHADLPSVPVHPVQLYELAGALLIGVVLDRATSKPHRRGSIFLLWVALYGVLRAILETFRGDVVRGTLFGVLSTSQAIGIVSATAALAFLLRPASRSAASHEPPPSASHPLPRGARAR